MKLWITLVLLGIILLSCYTYKNVQNIPSESGGIYKITDENKKTAKIQVIEIRQDSAVVLKNGKQITLANSDFINSKKRKYSPVKTVALYVGGSVVVGTVIIFAVFANAFKDIQSIKLPP